MAEQLLVLEALKGNAALKKEIEFETKLRRLLDQYGFSLKHIINLLDPQDGKRGPTLAVTTCTRGPRELKTFKNPHTCEVVETEGGNHKALKDWKAKRGSDLVESWVKK